MVGYKIKRTDDFLMHYGTPRHSGRYPWGSGKRPHQHSKSISNSIHEKAKAIEPKITKDVTSAAKATSGKMYGLEHRLKTEESIDRKINTDSKEKGIDLFEAASNLKDAVRYTLVSSDNDFVKNYNIFKKQLQNNNYEETRCKNYFDMYEKGLVKHKSVQSQFKDPSGYSFEVQFQTPSSQNAKDKKLPLYEEARSLGVTKERKLELEKMMVDLAEQVSTPKNIQRIKSH